MLNIVPSVSSVENDYDTMIQSSSESFQITGDDTKVRDNHNLFQQKDSCRISFISSGSFSDYKIRYIAEWLKYSGSDCTIEIIRDKHKLITEMLSEDQLNTFNQIDSVPVARADFMKLLTMYHLGGIVADFDVQPLKMFPDDWMNIDTVQSCNLFLGLETECFGGECRKGVPSSGQIQTWTMFTRHPRSKVLKLFIDKVVQNLKGKDAALMGVQDISGSVLITNYLVELLGRPHYEIPLDSENNTLQTRRDGVLVLKNFQNSQEDLCILGLDWTSGVCSGAKCLVRHHYDGTWK